MSNIKVLSAGAVKTGVAQLAQSYSREHDTGVKVEFTTAPGVRDRIAAGEEADVVIAPPAFIDELERLGKIVPDTRRFLGRARMGVVVHADAPLRDIPDVETLKRTLTSASAVVRNKASSGVYAAKLLQKLGIAGELELRVIVVGSGSAVMEYVAAHGPGTVGLAQISEIRVLIAKGCRVRLAAPLPDVVQNVTSYEAAVVTGGTQGTAARDLAAYLANPAAKKVFAATGID
jgi:molybdate transport system substrate-binding protein